MARLLITTLAAALMPAAARADEFLAMPGLKGTRKAACTSPSD